MSKCIGCGQDAPVYEREGHLPGCTARTTTEWQEQAPAFPRRLLPDRGRLALGVYLDAVRAARAALQPEDRHYDADWQALTRVIGLLQRGWEADADDARVLVTTDDVRVLKFALVAHLNRATTAQDQDVRATLLGRLMSGRPATEEFTHPFVVVGEVTVQA